jgi:PAP2 superfamily
MIGFEYRWLRVLTAMAVISSAAALIIGGIVGVPAGEVLIDYAIMIWRLSLPTLFLALTVYFLRSAALRRESPLADLRSLLKGRCGSPETAAATFGPIVLMPIILGAYGTLKQIMPLVTPFRWDTTIAEAGRLMFGGTRPWHVTHAIFGGPVPTMVLDRIYTLWVPLLFVAVLFFALFAPPQLRARFFLAFGAGWLLLGLVAAFLLSSAGPCYLPTLGGPAAEDFADLMRRLQAIDDAGYSLGALQWQKTLWDAQTQQHYGFGMGVSAMPSMHNAVAFLYVLASGRARIWVRVAAWLFAVTILIGSVHLGWHYLADGIVAWASMALIWWGAGAYLKAGYKQAESAPELIPAAA